MKRIVEHELLDSLPHDHPAAQRNRKDILWTNHAMGNFRWFRRELPRHLVPGDRILEIGAGTGDLALKLGSLLGNYTGLDLWPRPTLFRRHWTWLQTDLLGFGHYRHYDVVLGNLIFHQFSKTQLRNIGTRIGRHARIIIACEPVRRRRFQWLFHVFAKLLRADPVSHHDAHVSIAAGFLGDELPRALGLDPRCWSWHCSTSALGAYRMIAERRTSKAL